MGMPYYPDNPVPAWEEFCDDYKPHFYNSSGYGSDALTTLCDYIYKTYGITDFIISPSARNKRAIAAYRKRGFEYVSTLSKEEQEREFGKSECNDNILMIKKYLAETVKCGKRERGSAKCS